MAIDIKKLKEYADFKKDVQEREAQVKKDKKKLEAMDKIILNQLTELGIQNITVGDKVVYLSSQIWAGAPDKEGCFNDKGEPEKDYERACRALKEHGLGEFVKEGFNSQSVSAEIRRMISDDSLPKSLEEDLKISEKFYVKVKKRSK